jgi:hypothetical protein
MSPSFVQRSSIRNHRNSNPDLFRKLSKASNTLVRATKYTQEVLPNSISQTTISKTDREREQGKIENKEENHGKAQPGKSMRSKVIAFESSCKSDALICT